MNTSVSIDNELINDALKISEISSPKELFEIALREFIENQKRKKLLELKGKIEYFKDYDYKSMRGSN